MRPVLITLRLRFVEENTQGELMDVFMEHC